MKEGYAAYKNMLDLYRFYGQSWFWVFGSKVFGFDSVSSSLMFLVMVTAES